MTNANTLARSEADESWHPEDIRYRVLLAVPDARHIPIIGLVGERRWGRVNTRVVPTKEDLSRHVGGNLSRRLQKSYGDHRLINVRRRVADQTAVYSYWLAFPELAPAEAFVQENPRFGLNAIEAHTASQYGTRKQNLENGVAKGRYNLQFVEPNARLKRARFYVDECAVLEKLGWARWGLLKLRKDLEIVPDGVSVG